MSWCGFIERGLSCSHSYTNLPALLNIEHCYIEVPTSSECSPSHPHILTPSHSHTHSSTKRSQRPQPSSTLRQLYSEWDDRRVQQGPPGIHLERLQVCTATWVMAYDILWAHVSSCEVVWAHVSSCEVTWGHVMSMWCDVMWCHVRSCEIMWCYVSWYYGIWCHVMSFNV